MASCKTCNIVLETDEELSEHKKTQSHFRKLQEQLVKKSRTVIKKPLIPVQEAPPPEDKPAGNDANEPYTIRDAHGNILYQQPPKNANIVASYLEQNSGKQITKEFHGLSAEQLAEVARRRESINYGPSNADDLLNAYRKNFHSSINDNILKSSQVKRSEAAPADFDGQRRNQLRTRESRFTDNRHDNDRYRNRSPRPSHRSDRSRSPYYDRRNSPSRSRADYHRNEQKSYNKGSNSPSYNRSRSRPRSNEKITRNESTSDNSSKWYSPNTGSGKCEICSDVGSVRNNNEWDLHIEGKDHQWKISQLIEIFGYDTIRQYYGRYYIPDDIPQNEMSAESRPFNGKLHTMPSQISIMDKITYCLYLLEVGKHFDSFCIICGKDCYDLHEWVDHIAGRDHALEVVCRIKENGSDKYVLDFGKLPGPNIKHLSGSDMKLVAEDLFPGQQQFTYDIPQLSAKDKEALIEDVKYLRRKRESSNRSDRHSGYSDRRIYDSKNRSYSDKKEPSRNDNYSQESQRNAIVDKFRPPSDQSDPSIKGAPWLRNKEWVPDVDQSKATPKTLQMDDAPTPFQPDREVMEQMKNMLGIENDDDILQLISLLSTSNLIDVVADPDVQNVLTSLQAIMNDIESPQDVLRNSAYKRLHEIVKCKEYNWPEVQEILKMLGFTIMIEKYLRSSNLEPGNVPSEKKVWVPSSLLDHVDQTNKSRDSYNESMNKNGHERKMYLENKNEFDGSRPLDRSNKSDWGNSQNYDNFSHSKSLHRNDEPFFRDNTSNKTSFTHQNDHSFQSNGSDNNIHSHKVNASKSQGLWSI